MRHFFIFSFVLYALSACIKAPNYPMEPVIFLDAASGDGFNQDTIAQGGPAAMLDTLILVFSFTDGDGDIGNAVDSLDVFFKDSRTAENDLPDARRLPVLPDEGAANGIEGQITLRFPNKPFYICCNYGESANACDPYPADRPDLATDTFSYTLQIRDRAGNYSNKIQTQPVTILCD